MADIDIDSISKLRVIDLREHLSRRGLSTSGLKADLVKRLRGALEDENTEDGTAIQSPEEAMSVDEPTSEEKQTSEEEDSKTEDEENMAIEEENSPADENIASTEKDEKLQIETEQMQIEEENQILKERIKIQEAEKRQMEEEMKAEAERRRIEEEKAEAERLRIEDEEKVEAEKQRIEDERKAEVRRQIEEERKAEERRQIEEERKAEERRQIVEERKAEERRQIEEERKAEERRQIVEERKAEERRQIEEERKAEAKRRQIEDERKAEAKRRQIEEERKAEAERRQIEEERKAEAERQQIEEERKVEAERKAEAKRQQIEEEERLRILEEKQKAEKLRIDNEKKREAERLHIEEQKKAESERLKIQEEKKRVEAERLQAEEEKRKAIAERLRIEEERKVEADRLQVEEERRIAEADRLRVAEEKRKAEEERIRNEEERKKAEKFKMEEELRKAEKLRIEEEKKKAEEERKQAEEKRDERRRADERIREEKRIAAAEERRKAEEEEMKKEQERWLVEEQMRRAQEEHKKRLQAEEQKRVLEEQQRLMEEELERQQNEQQLYQLQQKAMLEQESQDFNMQSDINTNSSFQSNSNSFVSIPTTINIMPPPPPTVLLSNIPPPPSMIPSSHPTITPSIQVSAAPTRFGLPHSINIPAPPTPIQPFVAPLEKKQSPKSDVDLNDSDVPESMDTNENATDIRLPQALEKVLALKTERAHLLGIDPDSVVQPIPPTEERVTPIKPNIVTLVSVDEDEYGDEDDSKKKESKSRRRKKKKKKSHHNKVQLRNEINKYSESQKSKENNVDIDIDYVQEVIDISDPLYSQFMKIFEKFKLTESEKEKEETAINTEKETNKEAINPMAFRKKPIDLDEDEDDEDQDEDKKEEKPKLSKRKLKKLSRMTVAELKQKVGRPELVEMHDVTAKDPVLLLHLKASRNTVPVPRHWCFKRKYLQGKRGIEKPAFELPDFIKRTGIMEMRQALQEKEDQKTMKAKMRERVRPKLGKIDIDYQKLHDAFFKWQTKPRMTIHGDLYYEGKEFETRLKEKKPGDLSEDLRTALGMPTGPNANKCPPPWLIAMQRYGPPPSYPNLKIPGLNAPIPDACSFGYHAGGWGKPPVDETGRPLYGDVFGTQMADNQPHIQEEEIDHTLWGELESESSEEEEEEEEDEEEEEEEKQEDETGLVTPAEGLITPSGFSSIPAGMETPDMIELRKRKIEAEKEGGETPALYTILPEKKTERIGAAMMGSTHIYDLAAAIPASKLKMAGTTSVPPQGVEVALDPSELEMDSAAMAARYEQTMREQQSHLEKEDLSDMVAEHAARQKNKRKKQQLDSAKPPKKYKEFKF